MKKLGITLFAIAVFIIFFVISSFLLRNIFMEIKRRAVQKNYGEIHRVVKNTEDALQLFFKGILADLHYLAINEDIIQNTPKGQKLLDNYYTTHHVKSLDNYIYGISRIDEYGTAIYVTPGKTFTGYNVLSRKHVREALRIKKPLVSNIFTTLGGDRVLAVVYPVFDSERKFKGLISTLIPYNYFIEGFLNNLKYKSASNIYLLDKDGKVLFATEMEEVGESFFDIPEHYFKYRRLYDDIKRRRTGMRHLPQRSDSLDGAYVYINLIKIPFNTWTLLIDIPEKSMTPNLEFFSTQFLYARIFMLTLMIVIFFLYAWRERKFAMMFKEKEFIFKAISQTTGQIVFEYDFSKNTVNWFCNVERLLGYSDDKFINSTPEKLIKYVHPDDRKRVWKERMDMIKNKYPKMKREFRLRHKSGKYIYVEEASVMLFNRKNEPIRLLGSLRDITYHKIREEELKKYREHLEELVEKRTRDLEKTLSRLRKEIVQRREKEKQLEDAMKKVQAANKLKSEFLAQMSHEIRTPINVIVSHVSLLQMELEDQIDEDMKISLKAISSAGDRIIRTVELILNMADLQTGGYEPHFREWDIYNQILRRIYLEYVPRAKEKNVNLIMEEPQGDVTETVDEFSVRQILANLLDNAVKYTEEGEIRIKSYRNDGNKLVIEIADTGIGIDEEYLPFLFEAFSQEQQGYTRKFEGNGLGLALVKQYAEINNIKITVKSKKNVGTTFILTFNGINK